MREERSANINTPEYWDRVYRGEWERNEVASGSYMRDYGPIHDAVVELIQDGSRVLDVGCGSGVLCRKIKRRRPGARVTGVDFSAYAIERNREMDRDAGIEYVCLDVRTALGALPPAFDVVTLCETLEHLDEPERVVGAAVGLLRPGGLFVLTCPHDAEVPDPEHVREWGHDSVFHLLEPYSDRVTFVHFPPPYYHPWMLAYLTKGVSGARTGRLPTSRP